MVGRVLFSWCVVESRMGYVVGDQIGLKTYKSTNARIMLTPLDLSKQPIDDPSNQSLGK